MEHEKLIRTVTAAQKGDSAALNELFNAYYNDVYYFALKTVKDEELACDITQETFVEIINTLGQLQAPGAFVTWMKQITYHQCTRYFKKKKDVLVDEDEEGNSIFDTLAEERAEFIPDEAMDQADFRQTILAMIDELSEEQRSAVMMLYFDELSVKQIAEIQGVSEGTVKSRLNYARKAIKSSVETYEKKNGIKLHSVAILPLLLWLFQGAGEAMPAASAASVAAGVSAATGTAVAVSAGASAAAATTATAAAVTATKAAVPLVAKIAAGVAAAAVAVGGAAVGISQLSDEPTEPSESISTEAPAVYTVGEGCVYIDADGIVYEAGRQMPAPRKGDEYRTRDYTYRLGYSLDRRVVENPDLPPWEMDWAGAMEIEFYWREMPDFGWGAICNDNQASVAPELDTSVNGLPLTYMGCAFFSAIHLTETPYIPDTVTDMRLAFFGCDNLETVTNLPSMLEDLSLAFTHCMSLKEVPQLPSGVTDMFGTFAYCSVLETAPDIPASVTQLAQCFEGCRMLTGTIRIDAKLREPDACGMLCTICRDFDYGCRLCFVCEPTAMAFESTLKPIILTGQCPYLQSLADSGSEGNITVK